MAVGDALIECTTSGSTITIQPASGVQWLITHLGVGDDDVADGDFPTFVTPTTTGGINEWRRHKKIGKGNDDSQETNANNWGIWHEQPLNWVLTNTFYLQIAFSSNTQILWAGYIMQE